MQNILKKLFGGTKDDAIQLLHDIYQKQGYAIVDYIYFANVVGKRLFADHHNTLIPKQQFENTLLSDYKKYSLSQISHIYQKALLDADLVLPDGIALQIFFALAVITKKFFSSKKRLTNLNGTDFSINFLKAIQNKGNVEIALYGSHDDILKKTKQVLEKQGFKIVYIQDGYTNLDWEMIEKSFSLKALRVLLVGRATPQYPIQEIRSYANKENIKTHKLLVMNQGGTFDFWAGVQKRAPMVVRKMKLEWLRRVITDPKRNIKKVFDSLAIIKYIFFYILLKKR